MKVIHLASVMTEALEQCAHLLVDGFRDAFPDAWPGLPSARREVREALQQGKKNLVLVDGEEVVAWIGALPSYDGNAWEIHPLVVKPEAQGRGHGRRLLAEIESLAALEKVCTLWLGSDDETGQTSLSGVDLYADPVRAIAEIRNLKRHPYEFYERCGFTIVGLLPDANGPGKPDIFLAKRVSALPDLR